MIVCPRCGSETSVSETRSHGNYFRRRRRCDNTRCNARVTTIETAVFGRHGHGDVAIVAKQDIESLARLVIAALGYEQLLAMSSPTSRDSDED